jgi:allantoin racemase
LYVANTLGAKWGVVSTLKRTQHMVEKTIEKVGLRERCALALCTDLPVAAPEEDRDFTLLVLEQGARTVIAAGAEVIVLGCAGMSGLDQQLAAKLGVPVIDAVAAGVVWAEALVQLGQSTSKWMTYRPPELKLIQGYPEQMQPKNMRQNHL